MLTNFQLAEESHKLGIPLVGIFNKDNLPNERKEGCYIINLQDDFDEHGNDQMGSHWTSFIIEKNQAAYWDPFGFNPPANVQIFLKPFRPSLCTQTGSKSDISSLWLVYPIFSMVYDET